MLLYWILLPIVWVLAHILFRFEVIGRENLKAVRDGRAYVIAPNHIANLDPVLIAITIFDWKRLRILAKEELFKNPLAGWFLRCMGAVSIERGKGDTTTVEKLTNECKNGTGIMIFPEGTRTKTGKLGVIKSGAFVIAAAAGADMLPVRIIYGTKDGRLHLFCKLRIVFGEPIPAADLQIRDQSHKMAELRRMKNRLRDELAEQTVEEDVDDTHYNTHANNFVYGFLLLMFCAGVGNVVSVLLTNLCGFSFPIYIGSMLVAVVVRNVIDHFKIMEFPAAEISTMGNMFLAIFLSMALSGLKLWQLVDLALPMIVALAAEVLLMVVFSLLVVFPVMGHDYDAAMITAGFIGFGMGATSNAMANMQAVSRRYGPSPSAYFVIPMVGGLFNDFFNAAIIAFCIGLLA